MERIAYGVLPDGRKAYRYELSGGGLTLSLSDYGARVLDLRTPDRFGKLASVVLGYRDLTGYITDPGFFGATVGRIAGRMSPVDFELDGVSYSLVENEAPNHLHGGRVGFDKRLFTFDEAASADNRAVFRYLSPDGEEGYPGNLEVSVEYLLADRGELRLSYRAASDKATPFSPTNHSYFNLSGIPGSTVDSHKLCIDAESYTPFDENYSLTGEVLPVDGSPADFRKSRLLGAAIAEQLRQHGENYRLPRGHRLRSAAFAEHEESGRQMEVLTTTACLQFYGGNSIPSGLIGRDGREIPPRGGFCLECQEYPNGVNHPEICGIILRPGDEYKQTTVWRFSTN